MAHELVASTSAAPSILTAAEFHRLAVTGQVKTSRDGPGQNQPP
jgi:hypothetical protein